jgi:phosphonoacetaldehyde hydrolase
MAQNPRALQKLTIKAVIFDWAGTTVDYGCFAPVTPFIQAFERHGVDITVGEARQPMGLYKKDHIRALLAMPVVKQRWLDRHGRLPDEQDVENIFEDFVPLQLSLLEQHAQPIPGTLEVVQELHRRGIQIGSTTGYTRAMMDVLAPQAGRFGYTPDCVVCVSDVPAGRPAPWMIYLNAIRLQVYPMESVVKVGDTMPDIEEGLNAGAWTVAVAMTGNEAGLDQASSQTLSAGEKQALRKEVYRKLFAAGAHFVVDGIWDVPNVIAEIDLRLAAGERP